jgi:hypothetical protein
MDRSNQNSRHDRNVFLTVPGDHPIFQRDQNPSVTFSSFLTQNNIIENLKEVKINL